MPHPAGHLVRWTGITRRVVWTVAAAVAIPATPATTVAGAHGAVLGAQEPQVTQQSALHNPQRLRASQLLERRAPRAAARVKFEWDHVPGAHEYVLAGSWTSPPSWAVQRREYHVTPRTAASWTGRRVVFEAVIPEGNHSWTVVALFGPFSSGGYVGDYANPTAYSFDVR